MPELTKQQTILAEEEKKNPLFEGLNKEQEQAVRHTTGPLLIVAGAGTGKTTVITRRIAYLVEAGLARPDEVVALTFTEKAASEMQERVDLLLPIGYYDSWISTFHSFCERILKLHALDIGLPNDFELLSETEQWIFIYKNINKFKLNYYRPLGNPAKFIGALLQHFSRCKDELISPEQYLEYANSLKLNADFAENPINRKITTSKRALPLKESGLSVEASAKLNIYDSSETERIAELANAYHTYQKLLLDNNYLDFGDLINYTLDLFKKRPHILRHFQNKFKFVMVDEFQDTNYAQYELVKMLAGVSSFKLPNSSSYRVTTSPSVEPDTASFPERGKGMQEALAINLPNNQRELSGKGNLTVVGDDDQSIYKFRGASVSNILKFKEDYGEFKQITLVENYRSSQKILDLAYNFIQANNPERLEVKLNISKRLRANTENTGVVEVIEGEDLQAELNAVVGKAVKIQSSTGDSWNEFAILIRANSAANELLPVLYKQGIPYTFFANKGLYKKAIILDLLAYIRLLDNCHDSQSLYRVLQLPKFHVNPNDISAILHYAHKKALSLYEALREARVIVGISEASKQIASHMAQLIDKHFIANKRLHATEIFVQIVKDLGIEDRVRQETLEAAENRELIEQFYKKIEGFEHHNEDKSLHNFISLLDLELEAGNEGEIKFDPNSGPESLKVMTIHSSKGLEFKYVFVINMVDQRFPTREKADAIEIPETLVKDILPEGDFHLQEERRLFYVAMTRAKSCLYLSWAKDYGGAKAKKPSVFLVETNLVPNETTSLATGKVVFTQSLKPEAVYSVLPEQFSYSQLNDFETCPLKYKYQHYLKLPVEGSCHLSFGQTIHKVFEEYLRLYKNNMGLPQRDLFGKKAVLALPEYKFLEQLYEKHWVDDWYRSKKEKEDYRALGKTMLRTFYEYTKNNGPAPKYIEQFFKLKLGNFNFVGKIDRADSAGDGIVIIDYKTGKTPKKGGKDLDQLYIYQWAAQEYMKERVIGLKYWYLQDLENQFIEEAIATQEQINGLKAKLLTLIEKIVHTTKYNLFSEEHKKCKNHSCEFEYLE